MPPKQAAAGANGNYSLTQANLAMIRAVLCCVDELKPNWNKVTSDFSLSKGHGLRDFRAAIKPLGLDIKDGKVFVINGNDAAAAATATPNGKGKGKRTLVTPTATGEDDDSSEDVKSESEEDKQTPKKKTKLDTRAAATPIKKESKVEDDN